jgi:hypothetical protein
MSTKKSDERRSISQLVDEILGKPALLKYEDQQSYDEVLELVSERLEPDDLFELLEVQEITNNIWEGLRFQKMRTEVVDAERSNAIRKLANPKFGYVAIAASKHLAAGTKIPKDGMGENLLLRKLGVGPELVGAMALLLAEENLMVFDRLESNRIASRKAAVRDYERRQRQVAKEKRLAAKSKPQKLTSGDRKVIPMRKTDDWADD